MKRKRGPGKPFQKGNPGGPGRPKTPPELRKALNEALQKVQDLRKIGAVDFQAIVDEMRSKSLEELQAVTNDTTLSADRILIARAIYKESTNPRLKSLSTFRYLVAGPEVKSIELSGPGGEPLNPLADKSPEELIAAWNELQLQIKERECKSMGKPLLSSGLSVPSPRGSSGTES